MKQLLIIVNPVSGSRQGPQIAEEVKKLLKQHSLDAQFMTSMYHGHAEHLANKEDLTPYDGLAVIGGDGTMHEVVNGLMKRKDGAKLPLGIIPAGTGNSLAHDLDVMDPLEAAKTIIEANCQAMDIAWVKMKEQDLYAFNVIGWGVPTDVNRLAEKMRWLGGHRYNIAALIEIFINRKRKVKLMFDGQTIEQALSFIVACNTIYTGNGMRMAPSALLDDGKIDLLVVGKIGRIELIKLFTKVFAGNHLPHPLLQYHQVSQFEIESNRSMPLNIDGQIVGTAPCRVTMIPSAIDIFTKRTAYG